MVSSVEGSIKIEVKVVKLAHHGTLVLLIQEQIAEAFYRELFPTGLLDAAKSAALAVKRIRVRV